MSMPSFPKNGADMTREQALTMIIASIALEERSLSHVIDAEGEKLQYILDRPKEACGPHTSVKDVLEVNNSITKLLDVVMQNQILLRNKLALALEAGGECPPDCPCPPPPCPPKPPCEPPRPSCPPKPPCPEQPPCHPLFPHKGAMQLRLPCSGFLWKNGCTLPWECQGRRGKGITWSGESPDRVELDPQRAYTLNCTFNICDFLPTDASGRICLECGDAFPEQPPLCFSIRCAEGEAVTLQYSTLLLPVPGRASHAGISFRLRSRGAICVEQAMLNLIEL